MLSKILLLGALLCLTGVGSDLWAGNSAGNAQVDDLVLDLQEDTTSCVVPQSGGMVVFDFEVTCSDDPDTVDIWFDLLLPDGQEIGPYYIWWSVPLSPGETLVKHCLLYISPMCMPGEYTVLGRCGTHCINQYEDEDQFTFEKLSGGQNVGPVTSTPAYPVSSIVGSSGDFIAYSDAAEPTVSLLSVTPQPCNPELNLRFTVQQSGEVVVQLFDIQGREVLQKRRYASHSGDQNLTVQTGNLPSGVYLLRLESNGTSIQRTVTVLK
jgi:hypothetical protein